MICEWKTERLNVMTKAFRAPWFRLSTARNLSSANVIFQRRETGFDVPAPETSWTPANEASWNRAKEFACIFPFINARSIFGSGISREFVARRYFKMNRSGWCTASAREFAEFEAPSKRERWLFEKRTRRNGKFQNWSAPFFLSKRARSFLFGHALAISNDATENETRVNDSKTRCRLDRQNILIATFYGHAKRFALASSMIYLHEGTLTLCCALHRTSWNFIGVVVRLDYYDYVGNVTRRSLRPYISKKIHLRHK